MYLSDDSIYDAILLNSKDPKNLLSKASDLRDIANLKLRELDLSSNKVSASLPYLCDIFTQIDLPPS